MLPNASSEDCGWGAAMNSEALRKPDDVKLEFGVQIKINVCLTRECSCVYAVPWDTPSHMQNLVHINSIVAVLATMTM